MLLTHVILLSGAGTKILDDSALEWDGIIVLTEDHKKSVCYENQREKNEEGGAESMEENGVVMNWPSEILVCVGWLRTFSIG